jgi:predicted DNA-binding transcriptional regulator AlpA
LRRVFCFELRKVKGMIGTAKAPVESTTFSGDQLAKRLSVSRRHIAVMEKRGELPKPLKLGMCLRWDRAEIESWIAAGAPARQIWDDLKNKLAEQPA